MNVRSQHFHRVAVMSALNPGRDQIHAARLSDLVLFGATALRACMQTARRVLTANLPKPHPAMQCMPSLLTQPSEDAITGIAVAGPPIEAEDWDLMFRAALELLARVIAESAAPGVRDAGPQAPAALLRECLDALDQLRKSVTPVG